MEHEDSSPPPFWIAVIVFESRSSSTDHQSLYEECFVLIQAADEDAALAKADTYGRSQATRYQNERQETISWAFKQLVDVSPVLSDEFVDGAELYARHFRNYRAYQEFEPLLSDKEG
jgi:Domain of unknown function (DUF4288)